MYIAMLHFTFLAPLKQKITISKKYYKYILNYQKADPDSFTFFCSKMQVSKKFQKSDRLGIKTLVTECVHHEKHTKTTKVKHE